MHITASELNKHTGRTITHALQNPVIVDKAGEPTVVVMSYQLFRLMEDQAWHNAAEYAKEHDEWASDEEVSAIFGGK
ncbi:MAG: type II toxin-antitoxin system Phd/YefM family antitoxin [Candidatus Paracaedibacteraceae bacterium]|nr:type II toxin-antitoxin system Phd/YefM family antitoxin [Candidatus Paracaedibacteraceae bacterium]